MKQNKIAFIMLAAAAAFSSCSELDLQISGNSARIESFKGYISETPKTRTTVTNNAGTYVTEWVNNDKIMVNGTSTYHVSNHTDGTANFTLDSGQSAAEPNATSPYYEAVYPSTILTTSGHSGPYLSTNATYKADGSVTNVPMIAQSDNENLYFKYLTGFIRMNLKTDGSDITISKIRIQAYESNGTTTKPMADDAVISGGLLVPSGTKQGVLVMNTYTSSSDKSTYCTLDGEGRSFWFNAFADTYPVLNIQISNADGTVKTFKTKPTTEIVVERGKITDINLTITEDMFMPATEIYYTTTDGQPIDVSKFASGTTTSYTDGKGTIILPAAIASIPNDAFAGASTLQSITLNNNIQTLGVRSFQNCTSLKAIALPSSVTTINSNVFDGCSALESVSFSDNVRIIGNYAFQNCVSLKSFTFPENSNYTSVNANVLFGCTSLTSIVIPDNVTTLNNNAFQNCTKLSSITLSKNVTSLPQNVFSKTIITELDIPSSVETMGTKALEGTSLVSITIPASVSAMNGNVFLNCKSLTSVTLLGTTPPVLNNAATATFNGCTKLEHIYVPASALDAYKTDANWSAVADKISAIVE